MNLMNYILKKKPNEAKCMALFLGKIKEDKKAKELNIALSEAEMYPDFEGFLNTMKKENYITWERTDETYQIKLTPMFFKSYAPVLNMI